MCVDTVFEAIFNCDAMPGDLLTLFSKQFSIAMPRQVICLVQIVMCVDIVFDAI